jgi:hypothetical protein
MANGTTACIGKACQHVIVDDYAACEDGSSTCTLAKLLEAEPSGFHDKNLIEATRKIRQILESIPSDPLGRRLSLLHTNFGSLLAWVDHNATVPANRGVRPDADDATIAKAMKIKGYSAAGAGRA